MPKEMKTWKQPFTEIEFYVEVLPKKKSKKEPKYLIVGTHEVTSTTHLAALVARYPNLPFRLTGRRFYEGNTTEVNLPIL